MMKKRWFSALLALMLLLGIATVPAAASGLSPVNAVRSPTASGTAVKMDSNAVIDYSNAADGYIMVKWTGGGSPKIVVQVKGPNNPEKYTYYLRTDGNYDVFPLSDGNGSYQVSVLKNVSGKKYSQVVSASLSVQLNSTFAPFLRPNQYVNFSDSSEAVKKAADLIKDAGADDNFGKVKVVYDWVVTNLSYDNAKASSVQSGYLPDVDKTLQDKKGICFDYAALMAAMLRSQDVPIKLVIGYTSKGEYHAWINVWSETEGWVENMIYFDGETWNLMDPTFASSGKQTKKIMDYISNSSNYKERFVY